METPAASRSNRYLALAQAFQAPEEGAPPEVRLSFARLFLGPGRPIAHPFESVYVDRQLAGETMERVLGCYAEAGLQVSAACQELPDHISLEFAFMAHLTSKEASESKQTGIWRQHQRRFLHQHLARWLPSFCQRIENSEAHPFYRNAALAAKSLVQEDLARLSRTAGRDRPRETGPRHHSARSERSGSSPPVSRGRYPNIHLAISPLCTLCTLCSDNCQQGALTVQMYATTLGLRFEPALCNGCRACLRMCPEDAITLQRGRPQAAPPSREASVLVTAPRVFCSNCLRPHIAEPWLERLAEQLGGSEKIRRSLELCPACKASRGNSSELPVESRKRPARA
jgi:TorA maturation chaperone TorD/NAD-dependent dihydropyrimidine dehydrogenase PreA subunit